MRARSKQSNAAAAGAILGACLAAGARLDAVAAPPDLRLEWLEEGRPTNEAPPVVGRAGETLRLPYQVRNVGGSRAFAVLLSAHTTLGPLGQPERRQPGPKAGQEVPRWLDLPLARGMREVCLEARLQTLNADDPQDPNPADNRLCRNVEVRSGETQGKPRRDEAADKGERP